jgi:hypothetical protein
MPLGEAFWIWAVTGGALVNIATSGLFLVLMMQDLPVLALVAGYALSIPYNILALVGVWRAADRHTGDRQWAETARIIAVVGLVILTVT